MKQQDGVPLSTTALRASFILALTASVAWSEADGRLSIMTLNVAGIPVVDATKSDRMRRLAGAFKAAPPDIVAIQELYEQSDLRLLASRFPYAAFEKGRSELAGPINKISPSAWGSGLAILSRYPVTEAKLFHYSIHTPFSDDFWLERGVLAARIQTPLGPLDVYATHLTHTASVVPRLMQLFELFEATERFSGNRPFIVLGDLNFQVYSLEWRVAQVLLGAADLCLSFEAVDQCATSISSDGRLDYILLAGDSRLDAIDTTLRDTLADGSPAYSDHFALAASIMPDSFPKTRTPGPQRVAAFKKIAFELDALLEDVDNRGFLTGYWSADLYRSMKALRERLQRRIDAGR